MTEPSTFRTGKGHRDENFPVASRLIRNVHRGPILAFYDFVRTADDIADNPSITADRKLALLDRLEASLLGSSENRVREAEALRQWLIERSLSPRHAQDLLKAFRLDATKKRYRDWRDLMDYCSYSAMPVGRFVLDVHGENPAAWPASDAICAGLQIINHLQDCGEDYRNLDRVYLPLDELQALGIGVSTLGMVRAAPELSACIALLADRAHALVCAGEQLPGMVKDLRLGFEIAVITRLALRLSEMLKTRDPLSERVHLGKAGMLGYAFLGVAQEMTRRIGRKTRPSSGR
jgi:squalene synthase HpnC